MLRPRLGLNINAGLGGATSAAWRSIDASFASRRWQIALTTASPSTGGGDRAPGRLTAGRRNLTTAHDGR